MAELHARIEGRVGRVSLDRPKALNALSHAMLQGFTDAMLAWRDDPAVEAVLIDHEGPRGFCAGGDVLWLAKASAEEVEAFFLTEYRLNEFLHRYPKPTVAVMDGITMGGGLGIAWPCRYRIATEASLLAMPEGAIGLFPDVGMGWRLPRLPGRVGLWMALTGARIGPADALLIGLATDYVPKARLETLKAAILAAPSEIDTHLAEVEGDAGEPPLGLVRDAINTLFAGERVETILAALAADGSSWAQAQRAALTAASPTTLKVAERLLAEGARHSLADEMVVEHGLATRIAAGREFREGVRAQLIDKDHAPRWDPPSLDRVDAVAVSALFAPLPPGRGWTPLA